MTVDPAQALAGQITSPTHTRRLRTLATQARARADADQYLAELIERALTIHQNGDPQ